MQRKVLISLFVFTIFFGGFFVYVKADTPAPTITSIDQISSCGARINFNSTIIGKYVFQASTASNFPTTGQKTFSFDAKEDDGVTYIERSGNLITTSTSKRVSYLYGEFYNPNTQYYFRTKVIPSSGSAESPWSSSRNVLTPFFQDVGSPQDIQGSWAEAGYKISVSWARGNLTPPKFNAYGGFEIHRAVSTDGGNTYSQYALVQRLGNSSLLFYEDNARGAWLDSDLSYKYKIYAYQSDFECVLGLDYLTQNPNQLKLSPASSEIIFPARPSNLTATVTADKKIKLQWQDKSSGAGNESSFEIWRKFENGEFSKLTQTNSGQINYIDSNIQTGKNYTYKVRACHSTGPCSAFTPEVQQSVGAGATAFLNASLYYATKQAGNFYFNWLQDLGTNYTVERKEAPNGGWGAVCGEGQINECRNTATAGKDYSFRLKSAKDGITAYSSEYAFSLKGIDITKSEVTPISGSATAWNASGSQSPGKGFGWISLNSDAKKADGSLHSPSVKYSVQVDSTGLLSGYGWGAIKTVSSGDEHEWGWISFNKNDLVGCNTTYGDCEAKVETSGKVKGWARWMQAKWNLENGEESWDGFISLRSLATSPYQYGLCLGNSTGAIVTIGSKNFVTGETCTGDGISSPKLTGLAWGGSNIGGWIGFGQDQISFGGLQITGPNTVAFYDTVQYNSNQETDWFVDNILGGTSGVSGIVSPTRGTSVSYFARTTPSKGSVIIKAKDVQNNDEATKTISLLNPYNVICYSNDETSIRVSGIKNYTNPNYPNHVVKFFGGKDGAQVSELKSLPISPGDSVSFVHLIPEADRASSFRYYIKTEIDSNSTSTPFVAGCQVGAPPITDAPTRLNAWGGHYSQPDGHIIYVNWRDNSKTTLPFHFELQRIKLTPLAPDNGSLRISNIISPIGNSGWKIGLTWKNSTTETPYTHEYERTSTGLPTYKGSFSGGYINPTPPQSVPLVFTGLDENSGIQEGTTYFYKIRACSYIDSSGFYAEPISPTGTKHPSKACGKYSDSVSTTTSPNAPTNLSAERLLSGSGFKISWTDTSSKESGFELWAKKDVLGSQYSVLEPNLAANTNVYNHTADVGNNDYYYKIRSFVNIPSGKIYSSFSNEIYTGEPISLEPPAGNDILAEVPQSGWFKRVYSPTNILAQAIESFKDFSRPLNYLALGLQENISDFVGKISRFAGNLFIKNAKVAESQTFPWNNYFNSAQSFSVSAPFYKDKNLLEDTVYMYRARLVFDSGSNPSSDWSNLGVAKTLPASPSQTSEKSPVCVRNSFCDQSIVRNSFGSGPDIEISEQQCRANADCRNVGRLDQTYKEN